MRPMIWYLREVITLASLAGCVWLVAKLTGFA
jgi:hypothetical protein